MHEAFLVETEATPRPRRGRGVPTPRRDRAEEILRLETASRPRAHPTSGRLKLQDWTMTDQRKCKGGHCNGTQTDGVARVDIAGLDIVGRPRSHIHIISRTDVVLKRSGEA